MIGRSPSALSPEVLAWGLIWRLSLAALLAVVVAWVLYRAVKRYGCDNTLRAVLPLGLALMLGGCFRALSPTGSEPLFAPRLQAAEVAAVDPHVSATTTASPLDTAINAMDRYLSSRGLGPREEARSLRELSWWDPPPPAGVGGDERWWATYYQSWLPSWSYRKTVPCELTRRYAVVGVFSGGETKYGEELVAAGAVQDGCRLGSIVANPQSKGQAAEVHHRHSPVWGKAQCHGLGVRSGLRIMSERGHVVRHFVGEGVDDERLRLLPDCRMSTLAQAIVGAAADSGGGGAPPPARPACDLVGWSADPVVPELCGITQSADSTGCCRRTRPLSSGKLYCIDNPGCLSQGGPPPPPMTCPDGTCSAEESITGSCPADCPVVEPPEEPIEPPVEEPGECSEALTVAADIAEALRAALLAAEVECRP